MNQSHSRITIYKCLQSSQNLQYNLRAQMKTRIPRPNKTMSIQKIIINTNNISFNSNYTINNLKKSKGNKSVDGVKKRYRSPAKKPKCPTELKPFDLSEEMIKCRERDLAEIRKSVALLKYYNCLISLFMIAYTSSQVLASNFFQVRTRSYFFPEMPNQFGVNFIGLLLKVYQKAKNSELQLKLRKFASNLLKITPSPSEFEKKVQFISRKVVLNRQKAKQIQMSFVNPQVEYFWGRLLGKVFINNQIQFLQDMFELEAEKLCVKNFQQLIQSYLSTDQFEVDLKEHSSLSQQGNQLHSFDIQFLLIQRLCVQDSRDDLLEQKKGKNKSLGCLIY